MTAAPFQPNIGQPNVGPIEGAADVPAGDLGVGGPADDPGETGVAPAPPGLPAEVDPAEGPLAGREDSALGDLRNPGAPPAR